MAARLAALYPLTATGTISLLFPRLDSHTPIKGVWSRNTTLAQGKTWKVSAVVGLIAQSGSSSAPKYTDHSRRSFLAYSERERAVPATRRLTAFQKRRNTFHKRPTAFQKRREATGERRQRRERSGNDKEGTPSYGAFPP